MSDLKDTIFKFTSSVAKTSGEIVKSTKLSINLASEEDKLKAMYIEMGKKVHEIYSYGGSLGHAFDDNIKKVEGQLEKIKNIRNQIDVVKGTKTCSKCGKSMTRSAEFCPKCGNKTGDLDVPETVSTQPALQTEVVMPASATEAQTVKKCNACGYENNEETKFCLHCGRIL